MSEKSCSLLFFHKRLEKVGEFECCNLHSKNLLKKGLVQKSARILPKTKADFVPAKEFAEHKCFVPAYFCYFCVQKSAKAVQKN